MIIIFTMASNFFFGQDKYQTFWLDSLVHPLTRQILFTGTVIFTCSCIRGCVIHDNVKNVHFLKIIVLLA